jgi:uncharacterized protein (TIGR02284 family)
MRMHFGTRVTECVHRKGQGRWVFAISLAYRARRRIALASRGPCRSIGPSENNRIVGGPMTTARTTPNITSFPTPNKQLEDTLRSVIQSLIDGQEGLRQIGEKLDIATLKSYFMAESLKRASFRGELEAALELGGVSDVKETGTATGAMQRTWADIKSKLGGGDHTPLETAEAGEDAAKKAYKDAMEKDLPLPIREMLAFQYAHVQASHDFVKAARDSKK